MVEGAGSDTLGSRQDGFRPLHKLNDGRRARDCIPDDGKTIPIGLTAAEVARRAAAGQTNRSRDDVGRTYGEIIRSNTFTRFNLLLGGLLAVMLAVGPLQDALFGIVPALNALIGTVQEIRAKRTLDHLSLLSAPAARVLRDGKTTQISGEDIVLGDIIELHAGDQVLADATVLSTTQLELDESLLTGESDAVDKGVADSVLSGSFVAAGKGLCRTTAVGPDAYARKLAAEAKRFSLVRSDLMEGINDILKVVTWLILPIAALLVVSQIHANADWRAAVAGTVAGLVAMVPQGLVLLTSIAFGVAALTLAHRGVLVQQLQAVETLARVDVVCFDKTGTLTEGQIVFDHLERVPPGPDVSPHNAHRATHNAEVEDALWNLAATGDANATISAIATAFPWGTQWELTDAVPFSSRRKWSAATFGGHGTWILGAPDIVMEGAGHPCLDRAYAIASTGARVLLLAHAQDAVRRERLPSDLQPAALLVLKERIRTDAAETLSYFADQGIAVKVISGDSPETVRVVAEQAGLVGAGEAIDARELIDADIETLGKALEQHSLFGRVAPRQKQDMVKALQARGHIVAMTGDGVNDVLAVKRADLGIAVGSGAGATRAVAPLVLLDGRFATLPDVLAEGRRVTANIERVANLFITKTVWAALLAVGVGVTLLPYPFLPRHISIVDSLGIGVPAFFLALAPNRRRFVPGFVRRVVQFAVPAGTIVAGCTLGAAWLTSAAGHSPGEQQTAATLVALIVSLAVLTVLARPFTRWRVLLIGLVAAVFPLLFVSRIAREFYGLQLPMPVLPQLLLVGSIGAVLVALTTMGRHAP